MRKQMFRFAIYFAGIVMVSLGIVLCKKCNMGISPVSSVPFVLEYIMPLSFGTLTMLFHFINVALQMAVAKKIFEVRFLLQIPVALLMGVVIDFFQKLINFDAEFLAYQLLSLALSVFFTAFGMVCMILANFVQNPPDGFVRQISQKMGKELGEIKIIYDILCAAVSVVISLVFLGNIKGMGVATLISAVFVGKTATWIKKALKNFKFSNNI